METDVIELRKRAKRNRILHTVARHDGISRSQVRQLTGYSMTTVLNLVDELLAGGLLWEEGCLQPRTGRPPTWLHLRGEGACALGIEFNARRVWTTGIDLCGRPLFHQMREIPAQGRRDEVLDVVTHCLREGLERLGTRREGLVGVGVGVPGYLDRAAGVALEYAHLADWRQVPLRQILERECGVSVCLENNINALTAGYRYQMYGEEAEDFVLVSLQYGVRMGMFLHNRLFIGGGNAGEIGHVALSGVDRLCSCGRRGCLDTEASWRAVQQKVEEGLAMGRFSALRGRSIGLDAVAELARDGDRECRELLDQTAQRLGEGLAMVLAALNPQRVLVADSTGLHETQFAAVLHQALERRVPASLTRELQVSCAAVEEWLGAWGSGVLALEQAFPTKPPA